MIEESEIRKDLLASFPDATLEVVDTANDKEHYAVTISSAAFVGKKRLEQHRMVFAALNNKVGKEIHALQLKVVAKGVA